MCHVCARMYVDACVCMCGCVCKYVRMCVYVCMWMCVCECVDVYVCNVCMCMCVHVHTFLYALLSVGGVHTNQYLSFPYVMVTRSQMTARLTYHSTPSPD